MPDPLPGRARPAARAGQGARRRPTTRSSASAWRGATRKVEIMRYLGHAHAHPVPRRPPARARGGDLQAVLERVPPASSPSWPSTSSAPTRWCPTGRRPSSPFQTDDAGRAEPHGVVGRHVPQRPGRHDLRRLEPDPAQHPRRDGARPAEGAEGRRDVRARSARRCAVGCASTAVGACGRRRARPRCGQAVGWRRRRVVAAAAVPAACRRRTYLRFRLVTQYGDPTTRARAAPMW